jgi:tRNA(fMet)-specific endonuclease VapC
MKYMLDTNICIYIIKAHPVSVLKRFNMFSIGDICISSVTMAELRYGVEKSQQPEKNKLALEKFTVPLEIMPFDADVTYYYGSMRVYLEKKGTPIGPLDLMIAAHAVCLNSVLVTNNLKEFSRIPELNTENWIL